MKDRLKYLGSRLLIIGAIGSSFLLPTLFTPTPSLAGAENGVNCPDGFKADFNGYILKCAKVSRETRPTVCPPLYPYYKPRITNIDRCAKTNLDLPFIGKLTVDIEKKTVPVTCPEKPGDGIRDKFTVKIDGDLLDRDICERDISEFKYPDQR